MLMDWLILAFVASLFWAVGVVIDKYILTKQTQNLLSYQLLYTITEIPILLLPLFTSISYALPWSALGIVGGFFLYPGIFLYLKAMAIEEASRVISLWYASPVFVLVLAYVFLQERISLLSYLGVILLVLGAMLISYRRESGKRFGMSPALGLVLASGVVFAGYEVLSKYVLGTLDYFSYIFWNFIGSAIVGFSLLCFPKITGNFLYDVKKMNRPLLFWRIVNTSLSLIATIFYYIAISLGPISLVSGASSIEPLFVFVLTLLLSLLMPRILKEETGKQVVIMKALAITLTILGTLLII